MKTRAAVARKAGAPLSLEAVDLEGPREGEAPVAIKTTGICHTDEFTLTGADAEGIFPAILGHEGAGVVVDVGKDVTSLKKGDHVIPLYTPACRSTFSNFTVLPEIALAKFRQDAPFEKVCYIGCRVTTGIAAVINTAKVELGARAVVFGLGGIGLNVIQGLRMVGAGQIVGVDINPGRRAMAETFGMTDFVHPKEVEGDLVPYLDLVNLTRGGADQYHGSLIATHGIESWYRAPPPESPARRPNPVDRRRVAVGGNGCNVSNALATSP